MTDPHNDWGISPDALVLSDGWVEVGYIDEVSIFPPHNDLRPMQAKINADIKRLAEVSVAGCFPCRIDPVFELRKPFVDPEPTMEQIVDMLEAQRMATLGHVRRHERRWLNAWLAAFDEVMREPLCDLELDGRGSE